MTYVYQRAEEDGAKPQTARPQAKPPSAKRRRRRPASARPSVFSSRPTAAANTPLAKRRLRAAEAAAAEAEQRPEALPSSRTTWIVESEEQVRRNVAIAGLELAATPPDSPPPQTESRAAPAAVQPSVREPRAAA